MIVDAHTHVWESPSQLGLVAEDLARVPRGDSLHCAAIPQHQAACKLADKAIVVAFKSHYLRADVSNDYVSRYVRKHPDKLVGFAGIDPSHPEEALDDLNEAYEGLSMKGVAIAPAAQDFHPSSSNACMVYERISSLGLPLLVHQGMFSSAKNKLEYARPLLLDEIAREFPKLKIVIARLGYPWVDETMILLGKHDNVYADISGLMSLSWRAYTALVTAFQCGVIDKLLFASGFPHTSAESCIESLYSVNQMCQGTSLPTIPREQLRGIVERPTLEILGISPSSSERASGVKHSAMLEE